VKPILYFNTHLSDYEAVIFCTPSNTLKDLWERANLSFH